MYLQNKLATLKCTYEKDFSEFVSKRDSNYQKYQPRKYL